MFVSTYFSSFENILLVDSAFESIEVNSKSISIEKMKTSFRPRQTLIHKEEKLTETMVG